ncbi:hypothetical protein BJ322DRAFT_1021516 [Thelephora terrestris]|uniref:Uncharacterized protein n=1 Tax=Thelephora terrestris TaxID=56493 RepID=A0A9P6L5N1_9AGAM|nr:hypothetical protein BJ322DRAFT_1021516 [Thelephora terrestris]
MASDITSDHEWSSMNTHDHPNHSYFGLLNTTSGLTLQPIKATKASPNAVVDEHLTWEQIMTARHMLITTANRVGWDQKLTVSLAELYIGLEGLKATGTNPRALILYHAVARKLWHEALRGRGKPFNVSRINNDLLVLLENQVRDSDHEDMRKIAMEAQKQMYELQRQTQIVQIKVPEGQVPQPLVLMDQRGGPDGAHLPRLSNLPQQKETYTTNLPSHATLGRAEDGRIIDGKGRILCSNWSQLVGCREKSSGHIHECSGCGEKSHGAQDCDRAQKALSADSSHR